MITRRSTRRNNPKDPIVDNDRDSPNVSSKQENVTNENLPKRIKELEESIIELRKLWLAAKSDLEAYDNNSKDKTTLSSTTTTSSSFASSKPNTTTTTTTTSSKTPIKANTSTSTGGEKPPIRALTRRESSRKNLENTLSVLCKEAAEVKAISLFTKPTQELERENYDKYIYSHKDMSIINERVGKGVEDAYIVMNDLLLMFQNAIMFYPPEHKIYKTAIELRDKLVPQWEKALIERFRSRH